MSHDPHTAITPESNAPAVAADYDWMIDADRARRATRGEETYVAWDGPMPEGLVDQFKNDERVTLIAGEGSMNDRLESNNYSLVTEESDEFAGRNV